MPRAARRTLFTIGGTVGLLVLVALAVRWFGDIDRHKPHWEAAASDALGMDVRIGGRMGMAFFPSFHVTAEDGEILDDQGVTVASAKRTILWIELLPLLRKEVRLRRVALTQPRLSIERDPEGAFNVDKLRKAEALLRTLEGGSVSVSDGNFLYADLKSGRGFQATDLDLAVSHMRFSGPDLLKGLSLQAELACGEIRAKELSMSALKVSVDGKDGVFELEPATMRIFGGQMAGDIRADFSGPVPVCEVRCSLPRFRIEEFLETLSPERSAEGAMDFSARLSMQGETMSQMVRTASGEVSLRGENLVLQGNDLDRNISRFKSSQSFNLVDVGAVFFAGPFGLAVTKGYNFSSLFRGTGGSSRIRVVVSDWKVERGVARAKDVAMATSENRIALEGGLDFVNGRFVDVTVAVIDAKGCARARQAIHGSFENPVVEKPSLFTSLSGPMLGLYKRVRRLLPSGPCEVFYSGSVAAPR